MKVYDPCVGSGGFLIETSKYIKKKEGPNSKVYLYGQDINPEAVSRSKLNIFFNRIENTKIFLQDSLVEPIFGKHGSNPDMFHADELYFDIAVSTPPFGLRNLIINNMEFPPEEFPYGVSTNMDYNFIQRMICSLKTNGRMAAVVNKGIFFRKTIWGKTN